MTWKDLKECGIEDGCVVNYKGGREYWCEHADQDSIKETKHQATVYCTKLKRTVIAAKQ